ncbi:hypothetical protein GBAR_LOCUS1692 [Geodia barretti]|uniref:Uncharacterized protein n=1 Tax=Geodia barretti TaxID=519541 RepID=A0AA35QX35_GEOBA|nr:hypothetical protein GBAR_LOCUS1692 [Geodia barretti]
MLRGAQVSGLVESNLGYSILIRYAVSEGGDSLLDSEEERDVIPDVAALPVHQSPPVEKETPTTESFPLSPVSLSPLLPDNLLSRCRDESGRPKVIRLDRRKKFRCIPDSLPGAPLPKRKKPLTLRPRKITKPSLLLEVGKGWMADPLTDCRQTLVANRMTSLKEERVRASRVVETSHLQAATSVSAQSFELWDGGASTSTDTREERTSRLVQMSSFCSSTSTSSFAQTITPLPCPTAGLLRVTGTANATIQEIAPPHSPISNPFYSKIKELSEPASTCGVNPFFSALQKTSSEREPCQPDSFSFSLAQFNT